MDRCRRPAPPKRTIGACNCLHSDLDYTAGWAKLQAIIAFMDELTGVTVTLGSFAYHVPSITRGVPLTLGPEPGTKRRFLFTVNVSFVCTETGI